MSKSKKVGIIVLVVILIALAIGGVVAYKILSVSPKHSIKQSVAAWKELDMQKLGEYIMNEDLAELDMEEEIGLSKEVLKPYFESISYSIVSEEINGKTAVVEVNVKKMDLATFCNDHPYIFVIRDTELVKEAFEAHKNLIQEKTYTINMKKQDGKWKMETEEEFSQAFFIDDTDFYLNYGVVNEERELEKEEFKEKLESALDEIRLEAEEPDNIKATNVEVMMALGELGYYVEEMEENVILVLKDFIFAFASIEGEEIIVEVY